MPVCAGVSDGVWLSIEIVITKRTHRGFVERSPRVGVEAPREDSNLAASFAETS